MDLPVCSSVCLVSCSILSFCLNTGGPTARHAYEIQDGRSKALIFVLPGASDIVVMKLSCSRTGHMIEEVAYFISEQKLDVVVKWV